MGIDDVTQRPPTDLPAEEQRIEPSVREQMRPPSPVERIEEIGVAAIETEIGDQRGVVERTGDARLERHRHRDEGAHNAGNEICNAGHRFSPEDVIPDQCT